MITKIFTDARLSPTALCGANLFGQDIPFTVGTLDCLVYESCEYKDSFLSFTPTVGVFLNMELDHTDYFSGIEELSKSFLAAMQTANRIVVNADDRSLLYLARKSGKPLITYGTRRGVDYHCEPISAKGGAMRFRFYRGCEALGEVSIPMLGVFNISNAAAALTVAVEHGIDFCEAAYSLSAFTGIERRLELIGDYRGRALYYDYAHHPTEIVASVSAVREKEGGRVTVIFKPHTFSRTKGLWDGFVSALKEVDYPIILDIDAVREKEDGSISSKDLSEAVGGVYCGDIGEIESVLSDTSGAIILMGAADVEDIKKYLTSE